MLNADDRNKNQRQKKPQKNEPTLDLNMGAIAPVKLSEEAKKKGVSKANQSLDTADSSMAQNPDDDYTGELDQQLTFIKKQTVSVKAGNVQAAFVQNLDAIQESLNNFENLKQNATDDIVAQYEAQKEQYEKQIEKLSNRVKKQHEQRDELA